MRILFLTSHSPFEELTGAIAAGAEIAMRQIAERLALRGHSISYLALADQAASTSIEGVAVTLLPRSEAYGGLGLVGNGVRRSAVAGLLSRLLPWAVREGGQGDGTFDRLGKWPLRQRLREIVLREQIELIHCNSSLPDPLVCTLVGREFGIPVVTRMGGRYWYLRHQRLRDGHARSQQERELRFCFQQTSLLAFNSLWLRETTGRLMAELEFGDPGESTVIDIGVARPRATALVNGIDFVESPLPLITCVAKLKEGSKRQDLLIRAASLLRDRLPIRLAFAGDGPTAGSLRDLAEELGVADRVLFLGNLTREQVFALLDRTDVFAHPTEFEGSSKAVAEAMLCGKAVVASDIGPIREHIVHGKTGLLAQNTAEAFAAGIDRVCSEPDLRAGLERAASEYAAEHFDPNKNVLLYEQLFQQVVERSRSASFAVRPLSKNVQRRNRHS